MALSKLTTASFTPNGISIPSISASSQFNGMKNLLINGDFRVWQKGTDLNPLTTGNAVTGVDRWTNSYCDFTARLRKVEDTIDGETVNAVEITKSSGTYSACEFTQKVETEVAKYLRGQTVTFSFWVKKVGSTFGSHSTQFWLGDSETADDTGWTNQRTYDRGRSSGVTSTSTTVVFSNNNWTKYSVTRTLSADTNTIYCTIYTGSTPTGEGIRIAKCQLEVGSVATDFERRPIALETQMSKRYYNSLGNVGLTAYGATGVVGFVFPVAMRVTPTIAWSYGGTNNAIYRFADAVVSTLSSPTVIATNSGIQTLYAFSPSNWASTAGFGYQTSFVLNAEF